LPTCPLCGRFSRPLAYVPILGPLLTVKCGFCRGTGSWWLAIVVQAAMAVIWAMLAGRYGGGWPLASSLVLTGLLVAIAVIDFQHRLIPSLLVYPTILIALAGSPLWPGLGFLKSLEGGALGFALFFALALLARLVFGDGALGGGDVTLAAAIGAICGYPLVVLSLALGAFLGGFGALVVMVVRRSPIGTAIPYGPYLIGGVVYVLLSGNTVHPIYSIL
ncbi:MAG TPA: A24 family peptidase, partial [Chloroflexota bacterium]|nr:A24 family peptidase [Chloroflexota bacterium]